MNLETRSSALLPLFFVQMVPPSTQLSTQSSQRLIESSIDHSLCLERLSANLVDFLGLGCLGCLGRGSCSGGVGGSTSASHLERNASSKRTGIVVVGDLQQAEVCCSAGGVGSSAGGIGWDLHTEGLDVC